MLWMDVELSQSDRQTLDLSILFYFMQIEISASSRNPTCEISPVVQFLLAPSLYVCVSAFFLPVRSRRHSCICDVPTCLPICLCPAMFDTSPSQSGPL